jgi:hypothetical protein
MKVPNTAVFFNVTTKMGTDPTINKGSTQGATMLWINGLSKTKNLRNSILS